ncbi:hypothetical protein HDU76_004596 [Blyttiomyces sp. JEL0837]|nr:hypothetical protein HDU76_004596 [Blyttiomyces sp. JEL0837]
MTPPIQPSPNPNNHTSNNHPDRNDDRPVRSPSRRTSQAILSRMSSSRTGSTFNVFGRPSTNEHGGSNTTGTSWQSKSNLLRHLQSFGSTAEFEAAVAYEAAARAKSNLIKQQSQFDSLEAAIAAADSGGPSRSGDAGGGGDNSGHGSPTTGAGAVAVHEVESAATRLRGPSFIALSDVEFVEPTPLPRRMMFILCVVIFSEPMSMTILFPFVYFMVRDFKIASEKDIGYYVGFIASAFSVAQFLTSIFWGWLSDKIGRRPVLLAGLIGNTITILMFGQSHSFAWAVTARGLCGFLNGNVGVAKSVMGEITDSTNQAAGFSLFGLMWAIGLICGPVLGGLLANPAQQWPGLFGNYPFLRDNPYFLPCMISACISLIGFAVGFFYLEETSQLSKTLDEPDNNCKKPKKIIQSDGSETARASVAEGLNENGENISGQQQQQNQQQQQQQLYKQQTAVPTRLNRQFQIGPGSNRNGKGYGSLDAVSSGRVAVDATIYEEPRESVSTVIDNDETPRSSTSEVGIRAASADELNRQTESAIKGYAQDDDVISITDQDDEMEPLLGSDEGDEKDARVSKSAITPAAIAAIVGYAMLSFQNIIFEETFSLWSVTPPADGGLGFQSSHIGICLSLMGGATLFIQLVVYPYLSRFYKAVELYKFGQSNNKSIYLACIIVYYGF